MPYDLLVRAARHEAKGLIGLALMLAGAACGRTLEFTRISSTKDAGSETSDGGGGEASAIADSGGDAPPPPPAKTYRRAFVTEIVVRGDLAAGDLTDDLEAPRQRADAICAAEAAGSGLQGRTFKAWIRVGTTLPQSAFRSGDGWAMVDGTVIFETFEEASSVPRHALNLSAKGELLTAPLRAWTGMPSESESDCVDWQRSGPIAKGGFGSISAADATWQAAGDHDCNVETRLYCFED